MELEAGGSQAGTWPPGLEKDGRAGLGASIGKTSIDYK